MSESEFPKKVHVTFDNFTYLSDRTKDWMEPEEHDALPELHPCHAPLWENYKRARAAHEAACLAVQFALTYPDGSAQKEVERQRTVFEELYAEYCAWTNSDANATSDENAQTDTHKIMARIGAVLNKERERG
jgi:hypothetical protein